jgi:hypothetical protein
MARTRTNSEARQKPRPRSALDPKLEITGRTFSDEIVMHLVDDWIVPALVEEFLRCRMNLPELAGREHNVDQP